MLHLFGRLTLFILLISTNTYAATQIVDEDFEDCTGFTDGLKVFDVATHGTSVASLDCGGSLGFARTFHCGCDGTEAGCYDFTVLDALADQGGIVETGGNSGKYARAKVDGSSPDGQAYSEPKFRVDGLMGGSREVYVKFDIKLFTNIGSVADDSSNEIREFKIFHLTDEPDATLTAGEWHPEINFGLRYPSYITMYHFYGEESCGADSDVILGNNDGETALSHADLGDHDWHTVEIYVDIGETAATDPLENGQMIGDGIIRIWIDSVLIVEDLNVPFRCTAEYGTEINSISFIRHAKALGNGRGDDTCDGNIGFDNLEVWDGMPDAEEPTPQPTTQASGHFSMSGN